MSTPVDLKTRYLKEAIPALKEKLGVKNVMAIPKITKITINVGIGSYMAKGGKDYSDIMNNIATITGQKPVAVKTNKSISNFKTKKGQVVGIKVTLRGKKMYDFLNKLINITLPRVRDFRGISTVAFDERGAYNLGLKEHTVFPEIGAEDLTKVHGLQITISTTAKNKKDTRALLDSLRFPFKKEIDAKKKKGTGGKDDLSELALTGKEREEMTKSK